MPPPRPRGFPSSSGCLTPMSERQQMALLMQMTSSTASPSSTPAEISPTSAHAPARSRDRNERGETALHVAAIKGDQDAVKKLLEAGMSPNVADFAGWTPLHEACNHAHYNVALTLVKAGANINAKGLDDDTPLHDAATIGHLKLVKMLVDKGAEANFKNRKGKSALDVAHTSVMPYLQSIKDLTSRTSQHLKKSSDTKKTTEECVEPTAITVGQPISSIKDEDDIYEFKSTPKDSSGSGSEDKLDSRKSDNLSSEEKNTEENLNNNSTQNSSSNLLNHSTASKRSYSDVECSEDGCSEIDDNKKKKRKDSENIKDVNKPTTSSRAAPQRQEKNVKQLSTSNKSTGSAISSKITTNLERKSPCASPKPVVNKTADSDAEPDDGKNAENFGNCGPKVPPLKIVIPQQNSTGDNESGTRNSKNNSARNHAALPYVVASSSNSNDSVAADRESTSSRCASPADSSGKINSLNIIGNLTDDKNAKAASEERAQQRVLRSSHRSGGQSVDRGSNNSSPQLQSTSPSPAPTNNLEISENNIKSANGNNSSPANQPINQSENDTTGNIPSPSASSTCSSKDTSHNIAELHPRKRKIRAKQEENISKASSSHAPSNQASSTENNATSSEVHPHDHPFTNCYQMYLNIRKQIEKKHKTLLPILPRPPQGFKDYLLNRRTYILAGNAPIEPAVVYPRNLPPQMTELFLRQSKERYKLKMQHIVEKEKLGLAVEQEILRVHTKAARSLACQSLPFSACTLLRDEEVYNLITPEQEEKDRNARSRYNGRLFLSWLQDVDDKWEKIKDSMLLRHHNEAESLNAVQKMDWEWVMKEHSLCDYKSQPVIDEVHVPMVHVSDDFDLLPA